MCQVRGEVKVLLLAEPDKADIEKIFDDGVSDGSEDTEYFLELSIGAGIKVRDFTLDWVVASRFSLASAGSNIDTGFPVLSRLSA